MDLSSENVHGRDIIIINPYTEGGGDHALAKKIANIALDEGCRVTISSMDVSYGKEGCNKKYQNYSLRDEEPHHISQLNNPLFIISPVGIANAYTLGKHIENICEEFKFGRNDIILIEEMDLLVPSDRKLKNYSDMLKNIGFSNISENKLGFGHGAIGYIPTDEQTINEIKSRFEGELIKLLDGYNVSLSKDNSYHLGYISSGSYITGAQVFIANTLCETTNDERNAIFIMSLRQLNQYRKPIVINAIKNILTFKKEDFDYTVLFSKATIVTVNSDSGDIESRDEITGSGTKEISIILTNKIQKNIYDDFLLLADTGMSSGDQSLSEYLSLKGKLPYYDMQPWKYPLVESIKELGGKDLENYLNHKFVGRAPFSGRENYSFISNVTQPTSTPEQLSEIDGLDKKISSNTATEHISDLIRSRINQE
ncbi:hypothetical protein [Serratia quinivorans]|uniref:hypothetical protein n=1 Tax=Serratia quinivorans TaxID=137545 RepID=UPI0021BD3E30|nr:hypothetical protein [Serratia quinivorans]